jgi:hypothetical protein
MNILDIVEFTGNHSVEFVQIISLVCLFYSVPKYFWIGAYILGFFISTFINRLLKKILGSNVSSSMIQSIFYSVVFVFLVLRETNPLLFSAFGMRVFAAYLIIAVCGIYNSTLLQSLSGSIVGSAWGFLLYILLAKYKGLKTFSVNLV